MNNLSNTSKDMREAVAGLRENGILAPDILTCDGKWHRCSTADKPNRMGSAYKVVNISPLLMSYRNRRTGTSGLIYIGNGRTVNELPEIKALIQAEIESLLKKHGNVISPDAFARLHALT